MWSEADAVADTKQRELVAIVKDGHLGGCWTDQQNLMLVLPRSPVP
jgi:hypothetical protein